MKSSSNNDQPWSIKLLYDGDCPLCVREVNFLQKKDQGEGKILFVNIAEDDYSPRENANIEYEMAMNRIHAIFPDESIVTDIEVFHRVYQILGMGWIYSFTKIPILKNIANYIYGIWADWRFKITGREDLITLVNQRNKRLASQGKITCQ